MNPGTAVGYAFVIGLVGVINPCGFPLLPAYLSLFLGAADGSWRSRTWTALRAGTCVTAGFVAIFAVVGVLAESVRALASAISPWVMIAVGAGMVALGIASLLGKNMRRQLPALSFRSGRGSLAMLGFGAAYAVGSLSCSLPIFAAGVGAAFAEAGAWQGVGAFIAYAFGMGLFVTSASVVAAFAGSTVLRGLRPTAAVLPRIAGAVCVGVGLYLTGYWLRVLGVPDPVAGLVTATDRIQATIASWLSAWWLPSAVLCSSIVILALLGTALLNGRVRSATTAAPPDPEETGT